MIMKDFIQLSKDTWYQPGFVNIGYHRGVIIDTGISIEYAMQTAQLLKKRGWPVKWILNTHTHPDHCGGNRVFMQDGAILCATGLQKPFLEDFNLSADLSYGAEFEFTDQRRFAFPDARPSCPDKIIRTGTLDLDGMVFVIESHPGHARDQMTITTPDDVMFTADITLSEQMLSHSKLELLFSAVSQIQDLQWLQEQKHTMFVPGHGSVYEDIRPLARRNLDRQFEYIRAVYAYCKKPRIREEIAAHIIKAFDLKDDCSFCATVFTTVGAYLMYLVREHKIHYYSKNGYTYYECLR